MPDLYIITGSNGAGKSTVGPTYLPENIQQHCIVFDGDKLFVEKRSELWQTIKAPKEVNKLAFEYVTDLFEKQVDNAISSRSDYVYEGHFTNDSTWDIPKKFKQQGYSIHLIFFGLRDPDLSQLRVVERNKNGGHWVDRKTIENNFYGNLEKLNKYSVLFDSLKIIETSGTEHVILAAFHHNDIIEAVPAKDLPDWFKIYLPSLTDILMQ